MKSYKENRYNRHNPHQSHSVKKNPWSCEFGVNGKQAKRECNRAIRRRLKVNVNSLNRLDLDEERYEELEKVQSNGGSYKKLYGEQNIRLHAFKGCLDDYDYFCDLKYYVLK